MGAKFSKQTDFFKKNKNFDLELEILSQIL